MASLWRHGITLALVLSVGACVAPPVPVPSEASGPCSELSYQGFPRLEPAMRKSHFVCHSGLALQYAAPLRSALWVVERLDAAALDESKVSREKEEFRPDARLPEGLTPTPDKFTRSGYDRGHLAPAGDFVENAPGMSHSFYTSNIVPQNPGNNRGIWARLEKNVRAWARQKGTLYVITGPVFYAGGKPYTPPAWLAFEKERMAFVIDEYYRNEPEVDEKGKKRRRANTVRRPPAAIAIPSHLYKVIYDPAANTAIAFVIPNVDVPTGDLPRYATTVAEVERLTLLRFFPLLPMQDQGAIKTQVDPQAWLLTQ